MTHYRRKRGATKQGEVKRTLLKGGDPKPVGGGGREIGEKNGTRSERGRGQGRKSVRGTKAPGQVKYDAGKPARGREEKRHKQGPSRSIIIPRDTLLY